MLKSDDILASVGARYGNLRIRRACAIAGGGCAGASHDCRQTIEAQAAGAERRQKRRISVKRTERKPPGRPRKPAGSKKSERIQLHLTPSEAAEIRRAAAEAELTITDYMVRRGLAESLED